MNVYHAGPPRVFEFLFYMTRKQPQSSKAMGSRQQPPSQKGKNLKIILCMCPVSPLALSNCHPILVLNCQIWVTVSRQLSNFGDWVPRIQSTGTKLSNCYF